LAASKLEIATTLAPLLDEPMAGMGHEDIDKIAALIKLHTISASDVKYTFNTKFKEDT
jgi:ABC-type branched-subunit amino acid transport system ATPase component